MAVRILCTGLGAGFGRKWKACQSGKPDSASNRQVMHGVGDLVDFCGGISCNYALGVLVLILLISSFEFMRTSFIWLLCQG